MLLYALTIFASAFLLFQVQPIIAKMILPWFGGSAMVWTSCMLFFQSMLLAGYAYAHWTVRRPMARQARWHVVLLAVSLLFLPILPKTIFKPQGGDNPLIGILLVLTFSVGLPYFLLSTTGPLLQAWYAARNPDRLPYRLFALSNLGSLLALLAYPFVIEPNLALRTQGYVWSAFYTAFAVGCAIAARKTVAGVPAIRAEVAAKQITPPSVRDRLAWLLLPACASLLLLAVTNFLSQNVAAIPFLWILPLSLYLLSFILCFDSDRWYRRRLFLLLTPVTLIALTHNTWFRSEYNIQLTIAGYCTGLFVCCMFCHGETARRRPPPTYLTSFYLSLSAGGATGGIFVGLIAPLILNYYYEFSIGLALTAAVGAYVLAADSKLGALTFAAVLIFLMATVQREINQTGAKMIYTTRNFYGSLGIHESGSDIDSSRIRTLVHGTINHGGQYVAPQRRREPTTYFGPNSGIGLALTELHRPGMKVGIIGLGTGSATVYSQSGDTFRYYEIDPMVVDLARTWFTYIKDCPAKLDITLGDGRLSLERQEPNQFDAMMIDAFSSDAIPIHLLTKEAVELYFRHLKPDGVLLFQLTNRYVNLYPVVQKLARDLGKHVILVNDTPRGGGNLYYSSNAIMASKPEILQNRRLAAAAATTAPEPSIRVWTDDYSNLFQTLR